MDRHRETGRCPTIEMFVSQTRTPGLPNSYVVMNNGVTYPVVAWLGEDREPVDDPDRACYIVFRDGDETKGVIFDTYKYATSHPSMKDH